MEEGMSIFKMLTHKTTGKISVGKTGHKQEEHIRIHIEKMRNWIGLAQDWDYWRALVHSAYNQN